MIDPLLTRAELALLENRSLRREGRWLKDRLDDARIELRRSILESAMQRMETNAISEDRRRTGSMAASDLWLEQ